MKAYLVNIDVIILAKDEDEARKDAMRIAPFIHKEENFTKETRVVYIDEVPMCSNCGGVNLKQRAETHVLHMMKQKYECLSCKMVF